MASEQREGDWRTLTEEVLTGMREWHSAHPTASFAELEAAVEERLGRLRARMLEDAALCRGGEAEAGAACPECRQRLGGRGRSQRAIIVQGNQPVRLEREYGVCPACRVGLFPPG